MNNEELVRQYAKAWNHLDVNYLEPYLSDDFHYESQYVFSAITSKAEYLEYLSGKFNTIKEANEEGDSLLSAEIGYYNNEPCIVLLQIHDEPKLTGTLTRKIVKGKEEWVSVTSKAIETVLLVECYEGKIVRGDICLIPPVSDIQRTGEIPL